MSHTSAASNKRWAQIQLLYPSEQRGGCHAWEKRSSLFLSSQNCHHQIAEVIVSDFRAIILMVTPVQQSSDCLDPSEMTAEELI